MHTQNHLLCVCVSVNNMMEMLFLYSGISSLTFTKYGEALYLHSSSELQRVTVSATCFTLPACQLELPPSARSNTSQLLNAEAHSDTDTSETSSESSSSSSSESDQEEQEEDEDKGLTTSFSYYTVLHMYCS